MRIGFIDSGVGGLSILNAVRQQVVADYIYVMDNRYLPYGEKSEAFIQHRLQQLSALLVSMQVDLIVIACNTATTQAVSLLREQFTVPFVGTVPAIKPAATLSMGLGFAVLATPATARGAYLKGLITEFAQGVPVSAYGSSELVRLAEQKVWYQTDVFAEVENEISLLAIPKHMDQIIVLGCTHFPFLKAELAEALPKAAFMDTAEAIARRVWNLTMGLHQTPIQHQHIFIATAELDEQQQHRLPELGFTFYQHWPEPILDVTL